MQLTTVPASGSPAGGSVTNFAIAHNAATFTRDMTIGVAVDGISKRYLRSTSLSGLSEGDRKSIAGPGENLVLRAMRPGENRWIAVQVREISAPAGVAAYVAANEMVGGVAVNGFGVGVRPDTLGAAEAGSLNAWRQAAERLAAGFGAGASRGEMAASVKLGPVHSSF